MASLLLPGFTSSQPVSYTHLDVYKRQAVTLRRPSDTMTSASSVAVVVPSPATSLVLVETSFTSWAPVSYTHLDVYKRQPYYPSSAG